MAGKQVSGEGLSANLAGMSKNQLYDIMSQMKNLIEQNQQQARHILIQNPMLTKALFQAQIMLGMVQSPQAVQKPQPIAPQNNQQSVQPAQKPSVQPAPLLPAQGIIQDQAGVSQTQIPPRKHQNQPSVPVSYAAVPAMSHQSQTTATHPLQMPQQPKGHLTPQVAPASISQPSHLPHIPPPSVRSSSQPLHPPQMPTASSQAQQPLQTPGFPHLPMQPPQLRPPSTQSFHPQYSPQVGANLGFQHTGASHNLQQSMFHSGTKPPSVGSSFPLGQTPLPSQQLSQSPYQPGTKPPSVGSTFPLGQTPLPSQQSSQSLYQPGTKPPSVGSPFPLGQTPLPIPSQQSSQSLYQVGNAMQIDRGSSWMPGGPSENLGQHSGPPGPPPLVSGQMGAANQPLRPPALTPDMEKALLQQVMSLTPEQINLLPPEQRNQVLQLQLMLRQ